MEENMDRNKNINEILELLEKLLNEKDQLTKQAYYWEIRSMVKSMRYFSDSLDNQINNAMVLTRSPWIFEK
jgi:hypothetical protein